MGIGQHSPVPESADRFASLAKITPPAVTGYFPRKRLFRLLDTVREKPMVWVSAPAGSGKTTLIGSYIETRRLPCLWYQTDEGDADPATFFYYMGLASKRAVPRKRKPLPILTPEYLLNLPVFTRRYFEDLFGRLKAGSVLVFDNCQMAPQESVWFEVIRDGLSSMPREVGAIMISRIDPPPVFGRMRAHRLMDVIGWKDLRLTVDETLGIARQRRKGRVSRTTVDYLQSRADGWAAGLVLLLGKSRPESAEPHKQEKHTPEEIFDYFAAEIFEKADPDLKTFLLTSAFLPQMTAGMAERLTGQERAERILSYLHRNNYFTLKHEHNEPVYQYHSLFREFLLSQARSALPVYEIARIQRSAAMLLAEQGRTEDAAGLLRECGDWEELIRLILLQAPSLVSHGRYRTLEEWISALPQNTLEDHPWLSYWSGVSRMMFHPEESRLHFERAYGKFRDRKDAPGAFLSWSGLIESTILCFQVVKRLDHMIASLEALIEESGGGFPSTEIGERTTCSTMKAIAFSPGNLAESEREKWLERALVVGRTSADISMRAEALVSVFYYLMGRDFRKTAVVLDMLRELARRPGISPMTRLCSAWGDSAQAIMAGEYDACLKAVNDGLEVAASTGVHLMDFTLMGQGALGSMIAGDRTVAKDFLRKLAAHQATQRPFERSFYHSLAAWDAFGKGDLAKSLNHSEQSLKLAKEVGYYIIEHLCYLQRAFLFLEFGAEEKAFSDLASSRRAVPEGKNDEPEFINHLAEAYFLLARGDGKAALAPLRKGMRMGREAGIGGVYFAHPTFLSRLATKALETGIEPQYVRELIRKNNLLPDDAHLDVEQWPWPLKIRTLGGFELFRNGEPVTFPRKVQQKPLLLLKILIALGGGNVAEAQINDLIWPESEGDLAHQSFATTVRRLRQLAGDDRTILLQEGRLTLSDRYCWVDAFAFERLIAHRESAGADEEKYGSAKRVRLLEKAIAIYKGPFLPGETKHPWVVTLRDRIRSKFLRAVETLGRHWESAGEWEKAIVCYRKGIEVDSLAEEFYRHLMVCYQRLGRDAEAHAAYRACRNVLFSLLGVQPSPRTDAIFKSLRYRLRPFC